MIYQVERSVFQSFLLSKAKKSGIPVFAAATLTNFTLLPHTTKYDYLLGVNDGNCYLKTASLIKRCYHSNLKYCYVVLYL